MEWLRKLLKGQGLEDEVINKIIDSYKTESAKHVIPKEKFNEVNEELKKFRTGIAERDKQLDELKSKVGSNDALKAEIQKLQEENKVTADKYEQDLYNTKLNNEIDKRLMAAKAKDLNIAKAAFNFENVKLEEGKLTGFDEQLKEIQDSHSYLFNDEYPAGTGGSLGNGAAGKGEEKDPFLQGLGLI